ncbi:2-amino-4-hydroxy-6-hydroxymethyldihydropteridine diphosphokinase [Frankia sp. AgKG'84/4]|uniref:2-amino-4-hydroxy-6- hydroxymethyldihydropteridine diphosphokinase n=1 Tax=Frankia sp. AgKG'84/4 TaxID=573490 RepID=UPI00200C54CC|nr:2-amino-4-hydroxy-6-hydroxymethyldihydropteridine diphosphokinase [Frankia sp. AgKG'84/4]MCL9798125.1 2-amino-4-hydroxy-6-hydroxymethyldihydropteridine diphosphokinase [Frankia sp. AgKG'84/4]
MTAGEGHPARPGHAVLALGSNLGDRWALLRAAVRHLDGLLGVTACSPVYETAPVGGPAQEDYLNAVVLVAPASPRELLAAARAVEQEAQRVRAVRWGPRTLDVDVIALGEQTSDDPDILIPHPRAHLRAFVCLPWLDVEPAAVLPGRGRVADLVAAMARDGQVAGVRRLPDGLDAPLVGGRGRDEPA